MEGPISMPSNEDNLVRNDICIRNPHHCILAPPPGNYEGVTHEIYSLLGLSSTLTKVLVNLYMEV